METNIFTSGVNDTDPSLASGDYPVFGLNKGVLTSLLFTDKGGKNESPADAVDVHIKIGDIDCHQRYFDSDPDPKFGTYEGNMKQIMGSIIHIVKAAGISQEDIDKIITAANPTTFKEWAVAITGMLPTPPYEFPVDIFMQYQKDQAADKDTKYTEIPKNLKSGFFICPRTTPQGSWKEVVDDNGLHFIDEAGTLHLFERSAYFMKSANAQALDPARTKEKERATGGSTPAAGAKPNRVW